MTSRMLPIHGLLCRRCIPFALCLSALLLTAGCGESATSVPPRFTGTYPIRVVGTVGMVTDIVRNVGGEHIRVEGIMGEGTDPHLYKASLGDVGKLYKADMVFYSGLHLEGKMAFVLRRLSRRKQTHAVTDGIPLERLHASEPAEGEPPDTPPHEREHADPHVWFDVSLWMHCVAEARDRLSEYDPDHADDYARNAAAYLVKLRTLHEQAKRLIATIPSERRVLVTAHDAFGYFGSAYGIEVRAVQGMSTESEAGVWDVNALVEYIVQRKIKAVFVESTVSDKNILALVEGCRARGHDLKYGPQLPGGGELFSDAMGKDGTPDGSYIGMVEHNVKTIVEALR